MLANIKYSLPLSSLNLILFATFVYATVTSRINKTNTIDWLVLFFVIYQTLTIFLYLFNDHQANIASYTYGINLALIPMSFYYLGRQLQAADEIKFIQITVAASVLTISLGVYFHLARPDYYTEYLSSFIENKNYTEEWQIWARMQGHMGSINMGALGVMSILMLSRLKINTTSLIGLVIILFGTALTMQRSAMVLALAGTFYVVFSKKMTRAFGLLFVILIVMWFFYPSEEGGKILSAIYDRAMLIGEALDSRLVSYNKAINIIGDYPFGLGLGATLSASDSSGFSKVGQVVDANHMRILCDTGIIGLITYIALITTVIYIGLINKRGRPYSIIIIFFNIQMIGSNVLDVYMLSHLFWFSVAAISNSERSETKDQH